MPIPFLNSITLNKNEIQEFKVYNLTPDPTLTSAGDYGYMWLNTSDSPKTLKWWDGTSIRSIVDSGNTSTLTVGTANDLSGGVAGSLPYQQGVGDTTFLGIGSSGYILTSTGSAPQWSASIPSSSVSGLAASATTDTTNASNISSGTLGLARLSLASGQFYVGDGSNNPAATAKSSIPLSGFGNAAADINIGGFKITNSGTIGSGDADSTVATKGYVDSVAQGLDVKASCLVATTADITLASPGAVTIDGIYSATDFTAGTTRILVKDQSAPEENGIYIWQGPSSAMTRSADANTWDELVGAFTFVERGTANADSGWVCTVNAGGTLGTTAVTFVKFSQAGSYTAGNGIVQSGTSFNFAQSSAYTAGQIPFAGGTLGTSSTTIGFDSSLVWDDQNNRLGVGTSLPAAKIHIADSQLNSYAYLQNDQTLAQFRSIQLVLANGPTAFGSGNRDWRIFNLGTSATASDFAIDYWDGSTVSEKFRIASNGVCTWSNVGGVAGTAMTLNGTGLGIGASPSTNLHIYGAAPRAMIENSANNGIYLRLKRPNKEYIVALDINNNGGNDFTIWDNTAAASRLTIDNTGNVGINTTTPAYKLSVNGRISYSGVIGEGADATLSSSGTALLHGNSSTWTEQRFYALGNEQHRISSSGVFTWYDGAGGTRMTLNATGLGVGVSPSVAKLEVNLENGASNSAYFRTTTYTNLRIVGTSGSGATGGSQAFFTTTGNREWIIGQRTDTAYSSANSFFIRDESASATRLTIDTSGNVSINRTSTIGTNSKLNVQLEGTTASSYSAPSNAAIAIDAGTSTNSVIALVGGGDQGIYRANSSGAYDVGISLGSNSERRIRFTTAGTDKMLLDASGNLGLGVTPSAWGTANFKAIDINTRGAFGGTSGGAYVIYNAFYNASNQWIYKQSDAAAYYAAELGAHKWFTASSGTAGNAITFTQAMTLFSNGALSLGTASDALSQPGNVYLHGDSGSGKGATIAFGQAGAVLGCIGQLARIVGGGTSQDIFIQSQGTSNNVGINAYPSGAVIYFQTQGTERLRIKSTGQVNFVGLASDPAGAAGDVVYNSTSNRLKYHNGTAWVNTGTNKYSGALAGTGTSFTVTHNLGTRDVTVAVRKSGSTYDQVFTDVQMTDTNTVTIVFASSVTGSDYTVTVIG